jgi:hypothetical protein
VQLDWEIVYMLLIIVIITLDRLPYEANVNFHREEKINQAVKEVTL